MNSFYLQSASGLIECRRLCSYPLIMSWLADYYYTWNNSQASQGRRERTSLRVFRMKKLKPRRSPSSNVRGRGPETPSCRHQAQTQPLKETGVGLKGSLVICPPISSSGGLHEVPCAQTSPECWESKVTTTRDSYHSVYSIGSNSKGRKTMDTATIAQKGVW